MSPGKRGGRDAAELVTLAASILVVLALVGGLVYLQFALPDEPPRISAEADVSATREADGRFYLPVVVRNVGGRGAEAVRVVITQRVGDRDVEADVTVDFLGATEEADVVAVLTEDPRRAAPRVEVRSFLRP